MNTFVQEMSQLSIIKKLRKENFDSWMVQIEAMLIKNDHWNYLTGASIRTDSADSIRTSSADEKNWIQKDQKVHADIKHFTT